MDAYYELKYKLQLPFPPLPPFSPLFLTTYKLNNNLIEWYQLVVWENH